MEPIGERVPRVSCCFAPSERPRGLQMDHRRSLISLFADRAYKIWQIEEVASLELELSIFAARSS